MIWFLRLIDGLRHRGRLKTMTAAHAFGRRGEDLAHRHLQSLGFRIVARNYRTRTGSGEADIVAWDGDAMVFVEVKSRATDDFGTPDRAVDAEKQRHIFRAAEDYVRRSEGQWEHVRFDIVSVLDGNPPAVTHLTDAFARPRPI